MNTHSDKTQENKDQVVVNGASQKSKGGESTFQFVDNRPEILAQRKLSDIANHSLQATEPAQMKAPEEEELLQGKFETIQKMGIEEEEPLQGKFNPVQMKAPEEEELLQGKFETIQKMGIEEEEPLQGKFNPVQMKAPEEEELLQGKFEPVQKKASPEPSRRENNTGLPYNLKSGIENMSGYSMDDVKVNLNSNKPAQLNAHAYAQGTDIHLAPGQEKHLPHEAWHVVQQKQGRVKPTLQMKGNINVNDDEGLEKEADLMGAKAENVKVESHSELSSMRAEGKAVTQQKTIAHANGCGCSGCTGKSRVSERTVQAKSQESSQATIQRCQHNGTKSPCKKCKASKQQSVDDRNVNKARAYQTPKKDEAEQKEFEDKFKGQKGAVMHGTGGKGDKTSQKYETFIKK